MPLRRRTASANTPTPSPIRIDSHGKPGIPIGRTNCDVDVFLRVWVSVTTMIEVFEVVVVEVVPGVVNVVYDVAIVLVWTPGEVEVTVVVVTDNVVKVVGEVTVEDEVVVLENVNALLVELVIVVEVTVEVDMIVLVEVEMNFVVVDPGIAVSGILPI